MRIDEQCAYESSAFKLFSSRLLFPLTPAEMNVRSRYVSIDACQISTFLVSAFSGVNLKQKKGGRQQQVYIDEQHAYESPAFEMLSSRLFPRLQPAYMTT